MVSQATFGSSSFGLVARGLVELHRLGKEGKDDSPEAELVRDAMDAPWNALSRTEVERAQWLSEDLYSVSEPRASFAQMEMDTNVQQQLGMAIEAKSSHEWDRALTLLRASQEHISSAVLSYLRGTIWEQAGYPDIAAFFYENAREIDPTLETHLPPNW